MNTAELCERLEALSDCIKDKSIGRHVAWEELDAIISALEPSQLLYYSLYMEQGRCDAYDNDECPFLEYGLKASEPEPPVCSVCGNVDCPADPEPPDSEDMERRRMHERRGTARYLIAAEHERRRRRE